MSELFSILINIQLPIFLLIAVGFIFQKLLKTDVRTYSKLVLYLFVPVLMFTRIYSMHFTWDFFISVVPFVLLLQIVMYFLGMFISWIFHYPKGLKKATGNIMLLFNTGNYGIPLIDLVFKSNAMAMASQMIIILIQNIVSSTFCIYQASSGKASRRQAFREVLKMPALYVVALIAVVKATGFVVPEPVMIPLNYISDAFVGMALLTLGIQLADVKSGFKLKDVLSISTIKLITAPLVAYGIVMLLGIKGLLAQALIIGIATPVAVNAAIISKEYDNEPDTVSGVVFATTVMCTVTLPIVIYFTQHLF